MNDYYKKIIKCLDFLSLEVCLITYYMYHAPILIYHYWSNIGAYYYKKPFFTQYYIPFIKGTWGVRYFLEIEHLSVQVSKYAIIFLIFITVVFAADVVLNVINKKKKIILWVFCFAALIMVIFVAFVAAPVVIDYYEEEHLSMT